jgi:hypothetical protein
MRKNLILICTLFVLFSSLTRAQIIKTKLDFIGGIGYPEFVHAGIRYQYIDVGQLGFYYGGDMGLNPEVIRTWTIDNFFHFGKLSYTTNRPAWYARQGFTYSIHTEEEFIYKYSYIDLTAGREFGVTDWFGFNIDMGFLGQFREKKEFRNQNEDPEYRTKWDWNPIIRFQIFFSI